MLAASGLARADGPVVVELFTSQGCSSCPPADALLGEIAARDDVIALALHVDYWDYIGWADTFATPEYTQRQHVYAHVAHSTVVYTPQMVIGGQDHVIGFRPMHVADLIAAHAARPYPVAVSVTSEGAGFVVQAEVEGTVPRGAMTVQLVGYSPIEPVDIRRGENSGRTIEYHNVVTSWQIVDEWNGRQTFQTRITPQDNTPYAVIVQAAGQGPVLGAAFLR